MEATVDGEGQRTSVHERADRRPRRALRIALSVLGVLALLVAVLGILAHFYAGSRTLVLGLVAACPYLMIVGAVLGLVLLLLARQWLGSLAAVAVLVFALSTQSRLYIASPAPRGGQTIVVMTANLRLGQADPAAVVAAARRDHVDVLMLEELTKDEFARLEAAGIDGVLGHRVQVLRDGANGTGLWSRFPFSGARQLNDFYLGAVTARAQVPGVRAPVQLVALHMSGPYPDSSLWLHDIAKLPGALRKLPGKGPVVVGGDFNATTDTAQFRAALVDGFRDAADQAGAGYQRTWPTDRSIPPLIGIDHVLTRDAVGTSAHTVSIPGSDHRALLTTVKIGS